MVKLLLLDRIKKIYRLRYELPDNHFREFKGHTIYVRSVVSPDGKTILTGSTSNAARLWDRDNCKQLKEFEGNTNESISVAFNPDGKTILVATLFRVL